MSESEMPYKVSGPKGEILSKQLFLNKEIFGVFLCWREFFGELYGLVPGFEDVEGVLGR